MDTFPPIDEDAVDLELVGENDDVGGVADGQPADPRQVSVLPASAPSGPRATPLRTSMSWPARR